MDKSQLKKKVDFLEEFRKLNKKDKLSCIKTCSNNDIHTICECYYNLVKGGLKIKNSNKVKSKLNPIRLQVRKLSDPKVSVDIKRKLLSESQIGNGIFATLATIASAVIPLIISAATSK